MSGTSKGGVQFQSEASLQGRTFEAVVRHVLLAHRFDVADSKVRLKHIGVEIDFVATSPGGTEIWIEAKGTLARATGDRRPGLERTDTLKKAICNAALTATLPAADRRPFWIVTTHPPIEGSSGAAMLRAAIDAGYIQDLVVYHDPTDLKRLSAI